MEALQYFDRVTQKMQREKVYGGKLLQFLYQRALGRSILPIVSKNAFISRLYGWMQKCGFTKNKIKPFLSVYGIDDSEFAKSVNSYQSFNDFFTRKLKANVRPLSDGAVMPADGRYLAIPDLSACDGIWVKGKKFSLKTLLKDDVLAERYHDGVLVIARLCPVDYHRFHFPFACKASKSKLINGPLFSVNPLALKRNINILSENKRMVTELKSEEFGDVLFIEVGATNVGSIVQTYDPTQNQVKGAEKGYFEFGGSCLLLLFEKGRIQLSEDLLHYSRQKIEVRGLMGQPLSQM